MYVSLMYSIFVKTLLIDLDQNHREDSVKDEDLPVIFFIRSNVYLQYSWGYPILGQSNSQRSTIPCECLTYACPFVILKNPDTTL